MKQLLLICAVVALVGCGGSKEKATPETQAKAEPKKPEAVPVVTVTIDNPIVEKAIREKLKKPTGELTKADYEKVTRLVLNGEGLTSLKGLGKLTQLKTLYLIGNQLTSVKELEKLTQLTWLNLNGNKLTDVKGLENLDQLKDLDLYNNPDLTKAQVDQLQKALLNCKIHSNPTK